MHSACWTRTLAATWLGLVALGCTKSGQTGSPAEDPPRYETPGRFSPEEPGGGPTGNPGGMEGTNRPTYSREGGDFGGLLDDTHVVVAVDNRGVLVFDVSDVSAPTLVGELSIAGRPYQLDLDVGARRATLAVEERTPIQTDEVPDDAPVARLRLIHVDLSDPAHPTRVAHVDLDADFWQFARREDRYFVLAQLYEPVTQACPDQAGWIGEWGPPTRAMRVTSYALGPDGFSELESVELPTNAGYAWATEDAFVTVDNHMGRAFDDEPAALEIVDFSSGSLREVQAPIVGGLVGIDRRGDRLAVLVDRAGQPTLQTFALSGTTTAALGTLALPADIVSMQLIGDGEQAVVSGGSAALVDLSAPESPRIAHTFPDDVQWLSPVAEGLLGMGTLAPDTSSGQHVVTLWDITGEAPSELGRLLLPWPAPQYVSGSEGHTIDTARSRLLLPIYTGDLESGLAVVSWDASGVRVHSEQPSRQSIYKPFGNDAAVFSPGWEGFEVLPLEEGAAPEAPVSAFVPFIDAREIAAVDAGGFRLTLRERHEDGRFVLDAAPSDNPSIEPQQIVLEHMAQELIVLGDRVLALGLRWDSECDYLQQDPAAEGKFDACADYRGRGLSVIAFDPEPRVVESIAIDSSLDAPDLPDVRTVSTWSGYVELEDGRLAFLADQRIECSSQAGCDALGVEASESRAAPGCMTNQDCSMLPNEVIITSGSQSNLLMYVLEDAEGDAPTLRLAAQVEGRYALPSEGTSLDVGWAVFRHGADLGIPREEYLYNEQGNSLTNEQGDPVMRFWLDRIVQRDDGTLEALPSVNTPGMPVAWIGDDVYSVEPSYTDGDGVLVRLHRSLIKNDGAFIDASTDLGQAYLDARAIDGQLFVLIGPADPCAADPSTRLFAIDLGSEALEAGDALVLPGRAWSFPYGPALESEDVLLLRGGPSYQGHVRIDVSDPTQPTLINYDNE